MNAFSHSLPELSHLEFAILNLLESAVMPLSEMKDGINSAGANLSEAELGALLAAMENSNLVASWRQTLETNEQTTSLQQFGITNPGIDALKKSRDFYHQPSALENRFNACFGQELKSWDN